MINFIKQFQLNTNVSYGDKSISHRALILCAVANSPSTIHNLSLCDDVLATAQCLRVLGAKIDIVGKTAKVTPIKKPNDNVVLNCQNSGTTARLLAGVVSGLGITAKFVGDTSLTKRPMDRIIEPLTQLGAKISADSDGLFTVYPSKLVGATLQAKVNSAQVKGGVLLAGMFASGSTTYVEQIPTRNHTELLMAHCGVDVKGTTVFQGKPKGCQITIPNDFSSASYLIALSLLTDKGAILPNVGVNDGRIGLLDVLTKAGCKITLQNKRYVCGEKVADLCVEPCQMGNVNASSLDVCNAIDEIPALCALALATKGTHTFENVLELQHKESNRIQAIIDMAKACGQQAHFDGKNLVIQSNGVLPKYPCFASCNDHRIAMSCGVLCIACGGGCVDSFPSDVSFPEFFDALSILPKKFCVIGGDVSQSMSPKLMTYLASQSNVCCSYQSVSLPTEVTDNQLLQVMDNFEGANVTIPFKERVARLLTAKLPSVNTVMKNGFATSTDGYGVKMALEDNGVDIVGKPLWVVGAGGTTVAFLQDFASLCKIQIVNRTQQKADLLMQQYNLCKQIDNPVGVISFVPECAFEQGLELPNSVEFVFVSAYNGKSGLKQQAKQRGIKVIDGLQMLFHQGAKSFSMWTNTPIQTNYQGFLQWLSDTNL